MLQNKIYQNFLLEIVKSFLLILITLALIAITIRAVNFLDLMVESGYSVKTYFFYSLLNLFGIIPKFISLSFLLALIVFIIKHLNDGEFLILYTSGIKKIKLVNLFLFAAFFSLVLNLILSIIITPYALNKSRFLLAKENYDSFLPTVKTQQFSDTFKGFTFIVEKKIGNEIQNIFLHDRGNNLKNFTSNYSEKSNLYTTSILAEKGIINKKKMLLFNGQILSSKKNTDLNEIIKFEQLNIDLSNLTTATVKKPKIQETSTIELLKCFFKDESDDFVSSFCNKNFKAESLYVLNKRIVSPFYLVTLCLIIALLLIKSNEKHLKKITIFFYSFLILLFNELIVKYTGKNFSIMILFVAAPIILSSLIYFYLIYKFSREAK